jgi:hypothetical protein
MPNARPAAASSQAALVRPGRIRPRFSPTTFVTAVEQSPDKLFGHAESRGVRFDALVRRRIGVVSSPGRSPAPRCGRGRLRPGRSAGRTRLPRRARRQLPCRHPATRYLPRPQPRIGSMRVRSMSSTASPRTVEKLGAHMRARYASATDSTHPSIETCNSARPSAWIPNSSCGPITNPYGTAQRRTPAVNHQTPLPAGSGTSVWTNFGPLS